jgi:uncharacterized membrane protein
MIIFLLLLMLLFPWLSLTLEKTGKLPAFLSPVVLCYGIGILFANIGVLPENFNLANTISEVSILLAIPFLLYATDLVGWFRFAKSTLLSFGLVIFAGLLSSAIHAYFWGNAIENSSQISGMLVGLYTGGIPNMNAIGKALEATPETLIYLNAADIVTGGIYLLFLTSFAPFIYGKFLKQNKSQESDNQVFNLEKEKVKLPVLLRSLALTLTIVAAAAGLTLLITGELKSVSIILLLLTTFSIIASLFPKVRAWKGTFEIGEYFILIFCVAIGLSANFSTVPVEGFTLIAYTGAILLTTIVLHLLFCKIFRIDRDTMLITSVAALYGPPFVGQMASVIGSRKLLISGMATGLVGYALGNYLGIFTARILEGIF